MRGWAQNLIFRFLQSRQKVQIWLFEQTDLRIEGRIIVRLQCMTSIVFLHGKPATPAQFFSVHCFLRYRDASFFAVQGFDEYMNLVLDEAEEVSMKRKTRKPLGAPYGML